MEFSSRDLFVSPEGNDSWSGRLPERNAEGTDGPLATLEGARNEVRRLKGVVFSKQAVKLSAGIRGPFTVWFRGGTYRVEKPVVFEEIDSAPVTYAAYPGETPVIDGSAVITGWERTTVNGVGAWVADVPAAVNGSWDFRELFVNGERRTRPRFPRKGLLHMESVPGLPETGSWRSGGVWDRGTTFHVNAVIGDDIDGDGSAANPYRTIGKGVDTASTDGGDEIMIHPGDYREFVTVDRPLSIRSSTGNWRGHNVTGPDWSDWVFHVTADRVNISGLSINGTAGGFTGGVFLDRVNNISVSLCNITDNPHGIRLEDCTRISLSGNILHRNSNWGIYSLRGSELVFEDNHITGTGWGTGIFAATARDVIIADNVVRWCYYGMTLNGLHGASRLTGNEVSGGTGKGIELDECTDVVVDGNTVREHGSYGLYLQSSRDLVLGNNTLENNTGGGNTYNLGIHGFEKAHYIHAIPETNTVQGAPVYYRVGAQGGTVPRDAGFVGLVSSSSVTVRDLDLTTAGTGVLTTILLIDSNNCTISGNRIAGSGETAIYMAHGGKNNTISGNVITGDPDRPTYGIWLKETGTGNTLTGNDVRRAYYGIRLEDTDEVLVDVNTVNENRYGVYDLRGKENIIRNNTCGWNVYEGISLNRGSGARVTGNRCPSNGQYGISLALTSGNVIAGNTLKDNIRYDLYLNEYKTYTDGHFDNTIENNTGSGDLPIVYANSRVVLEDETLALLILGNADGSEIRNVRIAGSAIRRNNGLVVLGTDDAVLEGVDASGCWYGLYLGWSHRNLIRDSVFNDCDEDGVRSYDGSTGNVFENIEAHGNDVGGINLYYSSDGNRIANSTFGSNGADGILVWFSHGNTITGNTVSHNARWGVRLGASNDNLIYDNVFNNTKNAEDTGGNRWNIDRTRGRNIVDGPFMGGNWWNDYAGNDTDGDWLGDDELPHTSNGSIQQGGDELPLLRPGRMLEVTKDADATWVRPGETINYTITVTNVGGVNATNVTLTERYDPHVVFTSSTPAPHPGNDTWSFDLIEVNGSVSVRVTVRVDSDAADGIRIVNRAEAWADLGGVAWDEAEVRVMAPVLGISLAHEPDPVEAGDTFDLSVVVENRGHDAATEVLITAMFDPAIIFLFSDPEPDSDTRGGRGSGGRGSGGRGSGVWGSGVWGSGVWGSGVWGSRGPDHDTRVWTVSRLDPGEYVWIRMNLSALSTVSGVVDAVTVVRAECREGATAEGSEITRIIGEQRERTVSITMDVVEENILPGGILNLTGRITIGPDWEGDVGEEVEELTALLDGDVMGVTTLRIDPDGAYQMELPLPEDLPAGNITLRVYVRLTTGETADAVRILRYDPLPPARNATITLDPLAGDILPGASIRVSGNITIEPDGTIASIRVSLGGVHLAGLAPDEFMISGNVDLPTDLSPGNHTLLLTVTLVTGEEFIATITFVYDPDPGGDDTVVTITIREVTVEQGKGRDPTLTVSFRVEMQASGPVHPEGIETVKVSLDQWGSPAVAVPHSPAIIWNSTDQHYTYSGIPIPLNLTDGEHTVRITVTLVTGETGTNLTTFMYRSEPVDGDDGDGTGRGLMVASILLLLAVIMVGFIFVKARERDGQEHGNWNDRKEGELEQPDEGGRGMQGGGDGQGP